MKTNNSAEALYKLTKNVIDHGKCFGNTAKYPCISVEIEKPETSFELPSHPLNIESFTKEELDPSTNFPIKFNRIATAITTDITDPAFRFYEIDKTYLFTRCGDKLDLIHFNFDGPTNLGYSTRKYFVVLYKLLKQMADKTNLKTGKLTCHFAYGIGFAKEDSAGLAEFMEAYDKGLLSTVAL